MVQGKYICTLCPDKPDLGDRTAKTYYLHTLHLNWSELYWANHGLARSHFLEIKKGYKSFQARSIN